MPETYDPRMQNVAAPNYADPKGILLRAHLFLSPSVPPSPALYGTICYPLSGATLWKSGNGQAGGEKFGFSYQESWSQCQLSRGNNLCIAAQLREILLR